MDVSDWCTHVRSLSTASAAYVAGKPHASDTYSTGHKTAVAITTTAIHRGVPRGERALFLDQVASVAT